jgi:DNA polymerase III epsilon subunit-like protein
MKQCIVVLDTETSGLSAQFDWIVQLSAVKFNKETFEIVDTFDTYVKPMANWEMNPQAEAVHGLSKEFIEKNGKTLAEIGPTFLKFIEGSDIMGYNSNQFDILRIYKDFAHAGLDFPIDGIKFYDVLAMERKIHPNNLGAVFERYTGKTMEQAGLDAHNSLSDVKATLEVFKCQMEYLDYDTIDQWTENELFTPDGTVRNAANAGEPVLIVFSQGKYRDRDVYEVMKDDANYMKWAAQNMFSSYTLKKVRTYCLEKQNAEKSANISK